MNVRIFDNAESMALAAAAHVAEAIRSSPSPVIGLPAGRTPVSMYAELQHLHAAGVLDMSGAETFNVDEFVGLDGTHPGSFRRFMEAHFFDGVNVDPRRRHFLDGMARDLEGECVRYERAISRAGGIDVQVLGLGTNGHVAFNEPADTLVARTHRVTLHEETRRSNASLFGGELSRVPVEALSMGMATILNAATIVLMAAGTPKASAVVRALEGPLTTRFPASLLQTHRRVDVFIDREAAAGLRDQGRGEDLRATSR